MKLSQVVEFDGSAERAAGGSPQAACEAARRIPDETTGGRDAGASAKADRTLTRKAGASGAAERAAGGWRRRRRKSGAASLSAGARTERGTWVSRPRMPGRERETRRGASTKPATAAAGGLRRRQARRDGGLFAKRDERGAQASAKVARQGARRRGTRGAAGTGSRSYGEGDSENAAASRTSEVTWDICFFRPSLPPIRADAQAPNARPRNCA